MSTSDKQNSPVANWLEERTKLVTLSKYFAKKTVPHHKQSIWYYMGGITLFLLILQIVTGIMLLLYYRPSIENAFESVRFIMTDVNFGWLIRSLHSWSANLLILFAFLHLFSTFLMRSYRPPREITWISGVFLLGLLMAFGFTGYLLPWNELSLAATKVGTEIAGSVPFIGQGLKEFLRGGPNVTGATLTRMFGFHVAILPAILTVFLFVHITLIQMQGMSQPLSWNKLSEEEKMKKSIKFFPNFLLRDVVAWLIALWVLAALSSFFPWELGTKADLFAPTPGNVKPEWYFMFMFVTLEGFHFTIFGQEIVLMLDKSIVVVIFGLLGMALMMMPFIDRKAREGKASKTITYIGWFSIVYIIATTIYGYMQ
jgi:cytochrome b6